MAAHFIATQQAQWPPLYALQCEAFDAVKILLTAAGIRLFIKSPLHLLSLREAILFVLIAVIIVPAGTAFWGAAFTVAYHFGTQYWVEWRNLGISNAVTTIVLVPVILIGVQTIQKWIQGRTAAHPGSLPAGRGHCRGRMARLRSLACRDRTLRLRFSMHPFRCSSGRRCALGWEA